MFAKVRAAWSRLATRRETTEPAAPITPHIDYRGYRIRPTPYGTNGQYQTAGVIERDAPDGVKEHRFVRADTHQRVEPRRRCRSPVICSQDRVRQVRRSWSAHRCETRLERAAPERKPDREAIEMIRIDRAFLLYAPCIIVFAVAIAWLVWALM
jgi:hypothetical protein